MTVKATWSGRGSAGAARTWWQRCARRVLRAAFVALVPPCPIPILAAGALRVHSGSTGFHRVGTRVTYEPGEVTRRKDCGQRVGVWPCTCQSPALGSTFGGGGLPTMGRPLWDDGSDEDERPPERPPNCDGKTSPERELSDGPRSNWRRSSGCRGRGPSSSSPCGFFVGHLLH